MTIFEIEIAVPVLDVAYGALNAAMLCPMLPMLLRLPPRRRRQAVGAFSLLFGALLFLAVSVCRRHMAEIFMQPLPFVFLSRRLGHSSYVLLCISLLQRRLSR